MKHLTAALASACVLVWPALALACPVCGTAQSEDVRKAFLGSTIFLSLFPLAIMGGIALWVWWQFRKREREREARASAVSRPLEPAE